MNTTARPVNAAAAYAAQDQRIEALIARLQAGRVAHAEKFAANPKNWGFAGDLDRVVIMLEESVHSIGG
jgi:hypothetical protein